MFNFLIEIPKFPPPIAWIPFIILAFGVSEIGAYTIVFIGAFPSIFTSTYEASINLPKSLTRFADSLGMPPLQRQLNITLRYIAPQLFTSFKVSSAMAWMCVIAAEMISGQSGLGYAIQLSRLNMQYQEVIIYMLAIGVIGFLIHWSLGLLERVILPWSQKGKS
jgi:ABC-type nitrate/sulfonate/bicarbonate transport system permease component